MQMIKIAAVRFEGHECAFAVDLAGSASGLTRRYCALLETSRGTGDGPNVFIPSASELDSWGAVVVALTHPGGVAAGLYFMETQPGRFFIGGVITDARYRNRGLLDRLLSATLRGLICLDASCVELGVRIRAGRVNSAAYHLFLKHGFRSIGIKRIKLSGKPYERHLYDSCEADGVSILNLRMRAYLRNNMSV